jgi:hypothetical protein
MFKDRTNITVTLIIIAIIAGIIGFRIIAANRNPDTPAVSGTPANRNTIEFGTRQLINNVWGALPEENLSSGIFQNQDRTYGWYWDRPNPLQKPGINGLQPLYPNIKIGGDVGEKPRNNRLPIKVSNIKELRFSVDYDYLIEPTGSYNLSYQMYFANTDTPVQDSFANIEMMVWIHQTFGQPPAAYQHDFSDGNFRYSLYSFTQFNGMKYAAYISKDAPVFRAQHTVNAKQFLDDLQIDPNWYLFSIHFGNEILLGRGKFQINKYVIMLNGHDI